MEAIVIENLSKSYGDHLVIDRLSLAVHQWQRLALVAPSGTGKTTLFRLISGLEKPDAGSLRVNVGFSYMFQEPRLFPHFTVLENVAAVISAKKKASREEAKRILSLVGLAGQEDKYPDQLSGGMAQRAALARALAAKNDLLLLDEPFKELDQAAKSDLLSVLDRFAAEKTLLFITHDEADARSLSCEIIRFEKGMRPSNEARK